MKLRWKHNKTGGVRFTCLRYFTPTAGDIETSHKRVRVGSTSIYGGGKRILESSVGGRMTSSVRTAI